MVINDIHRTAFSRNNPMLGVNVGSSQKKLITTTLLLQSNVVQEVVLYAAKRHVLRNLQSQLALAINEISNARCNKFIHDF